MAFKEAFEGESQSELGPIFQIRAPFWPDEGTAHGKGNLAAAMGRLDGVGDALRVSRSAAPTRGPGELYAPGDALGLSGCRSRNWP